MAPDTFNLIGPKRLTQLDFFLFYSDLFYFQQHFLHVTLTKEKKDKIDHV